MSVTEKTSESSHKIVVEGSIKIAHLIANPDQYGNKMIQVSGRCININKNIMNRNWIHLQDGSMDDYDFVITSDQAIPEGDRVTMTEKVILKKDFGAGYLYDLILEEGKIVTQ